MEKEKLASVMFGLAAAFHAIRVLFVENLQAYVQPWVSIIVVLVSGWLVWQYVDKRPKNISVEYGLTTFIFAVVFLAHLSRLTREPWLFNDLPIWPSYLAVPVTIYLSWWNWNN